MSRRGGKFSPERYDRWRQSFPWTNEEIARALEAEAMDIGDPFLANRYIDAATRARKGHISGWMLSKVLGRLITHCALCGKTALYRTGNEGRCSAHRLIPSRAAKARADRIRSAETVKDDEIRESPCCQSKIQVVYKNITTERVAAVYTCLACSRLHVIDSRDDEPPDDGHGLRPLSSWLLRKRK